MNPMNNVTLGWLLMEILFEKTWELGQELLIQYLLGLATLGLTTILGLTTRNSRFWNDQYINSILNLATYIGFSDLNCVNKNWSLNPEGTVQCTRCQEAC